MRVEELTGRVLVDTNVLIYATLADPRHEQARLVLAQRQRPEIELFISVQNPAEMYPNLTGPKNKPPAGHLRVAGVKIIIDGSPQGKYADLVILDKNPLKVDPMAIKEIKIVETIKEGKTVYPAKRTQINPHINKRS